MSNKTPQPYLETKSTLYRLQSRSEDNITLSGYPINTNQWSLMGFVPLVRPGFIFAQSAAVCLIWGERFYSQQSFSGDSVPPQSASVCSSASSFNHNIDFFLESFKSKIKWAYCQSLCSPGELRGTISSVQFLETWEVVTSEELSSFLTSVAFIETELKALTPWEFSDFTQFGPLWFIPLLMQ